MKNLLWMLAILLFAPGIMFTSCDSPAKKVENAEAKVDAAIDDLAQARQDYKYYMSDVEIFRKHSAEKIDANNKKIADYKERIALQKNVDNTDNNKKLAELEKKNIDLKLKLDNYNMEGRSKGQWELFKVEINSDLDQLRDDLKDLTVQTPNQQ